ncbi:PREDICTED: uncharacterized protein LOC109179582 [Ipomoea nil]|uniref:uncharacterized protein LOC109179582 n=1 Tax=Ipomoea nil TaxID=35883 RepID=UPI0009014C11|nr:PREDICTED: uncharacterized protein LOC109179582 [Ipomoea nil]
MQVTHVSETVLPVTHPSLIQVPEASRRMYAETVSGQDERNVRQTEETMEEESEEDLSDEDDDDPLCPTIRLTRAEVKEIRAPWRKAIIVKVMGRNVGYAYLLRRLTSMWKPNGKMDPIAIDSGYFIVRFGAVEDLEHAMFEGPWMIMDHYLIVKPWVPDFDPFSDVTEKVLVWIRIPCLPAEYYSLIFLRKLGNKVGRTIRVDQATSMVSRGMFARVCVEVDITKPLISKFTYKGRVRLVAYEGIHMVCFTCGVYGHSPEACPKTTRPEAEKSDDQRAEGVSHAVGEKHGVTIGAEPFGAWMIAPGRRARAGPRQPVRPPRATEERRRGAVAERDGGAQNSRFGPLSVEDTEIGDPEVADVVAHVDEADPKRPPPVVAEETQGVRTGLVAGTGA